MICFVIRCFYRGIDQGAFQEEVLQQTKHLLENDFQWGGRSMRILKAEITGFWPLP